jgi:hypothetical protein
MSPKVLALAGALSLARPAAAQAPKLKVIVDQDARGPCSTDMQSILMFVQSPDVEVLGITVVSGDLWMDQEVLHTLRAIEIAGRTDIPVYRGAVFPLLNSKEETEELVMMGAASSGRSTAASSTGGGIRRRRAWSCARPGRRSASLRWTFR